MRPYGLQLSWRTSCGEVCLCDERRSSSVPPSLPWLVYFGLGLGRESFATVPAGRARCPPVRDTAIELSVCVPVSCLFVSCRSSRWRIVIYYYTGLGFTSGRFSNTWCASAADVAAHTHSTHVKTYT